jgi:hypothetical protein
MLTVHLAGIMYFHGCDAREKNVFVPDGTKGMGEIPAHYASIWVEPTQRETDDWFEGEKHSRQVKVPTDDGRIVVTVLEYRIPYSATLTFPDGSGGPATFVNLVDTLQKLEDLAPDFEVDHSAPETIVKIPIRSGDLEAFEFKDVAVVRWTIANPSSFTIIATSGSETKSITLKEPTEGAGVEIVFGNTSDLLNPSDGSKDEDHDHFKLFAKLRVGRKPDDIIWVTKKRRLGQLDFDHDYLSGLRSGPQIPDPGCEGTCC